MVVVSCQGSSDDHTGAGDGHIYSHVIREEGLAVAVVFLKDKHLTEFWGEEPTHKASPHPHPDAAECAADDQEEQMEICVRNTFIDIRVPEAQPLLRIRSAPPRSPARDTASSLAETSPDIWGSFSATDVSKALLEEKMDGASSTDGTTAAPSEQESNPDQW